MLIFHKALSVYSGLHRKLNIWQALFGFFSGIICQDMSCHLITHSRSTTHFPFLVWFLKTFKHTFLKIYFLKKLILSDLQKSCGCFLGDTFKGPGLWTSYPGSWSLFLIKATCVLDWSPYYKERGVMGITRINLLCFVEHLRWISISRAKFL